MTINDEMTHNVRMNIVNNDKGIFLSIDGHKFYFAKGSDNCNLFRTMFMGVICESMRNIENRLVKEGVLYTRQNEMNLKRSYGSSIFGQDTLFVKQKYDRIATEKKLPDSNYKSYYTPVAEKKAKEKQKKQEEKVFNTVKNTVSVVKEKKDPAPSINVVDIKKALKILPNECRITTEEFLDNMNKPQPKPVVKKVVEPVITSTVKEVMDKPVKVNMDVSSIILTPELEKVLRLYDKVLLEKGVSRLKRDDCRANKILYSRFTNNNYGLFVDYHDNVWMKFKNA